MYYTYVTRIAMAGYMLKMPHPLTISTVIAGDGTGLTILSIRLGACIRVLHDPTCISHGIRDALVGAKTRRLCTPEPFD